MAKPIRGNNPKYDLPVRPGVINIGDVVKFKKVDIYGYSAWPWICKVKDNLYTVYKKVFADPGSDGFMGVYIRSIDNSQIYTGSYNCGLPQRLFEIDEFLTAVHKSKDNS